MKFGVHVWVSGGLEAGARRAAEIGCDCLQLFLGNPRAWRTARLDENEATAFARLTKSLGLAPVVVHANYLVNLASADSRLLQLSLDSIEDQLRRAFLVGAPWVVVHAGYGGEGEGRRAAIQRLAESVQLLLAGAPPGVGIALENTAGGGGQLGGRFEELAQVLEAAGGMDGLGFCVDTCHAHAAGYDLADPEGAGKLLDAVERTFALERLRLIHANDAKGKMGSHRDLHQHIGQGTIGLDGFRRLLNEPRVSRLPVILETPYTPGGDEDRINLETLKGLVGGKRRPRVPKQ